MKSFLCAMLLAAFIIVGAGTYSYFLKNTMTDLETYVTIVKNYAENENWEACQPATQELLEKWKKTENWLMTVIGHREINRIQETLSEIEGYATTENQEEMLVKTGVLKMLFQQILINEEVSLVNIL